MPEPVSTTTAAAATLAVAGVTIPVVSIFGVSLGLRPELLVAGFFGSLVAIILLNSVPGSGDTMPELIRTTFKRMFVAFASSLTAGYLTPLALLMANIPDPLLLSCAFAVGGGAQRVLISAIRKMSPDGTPTDKGGA